MIDLGKAENKRLGDHLTTTAKLSEYFLYEGNSDVAVKQIILTYKCFRSFAMTEKTSMGFISLLHFQMRTFPIQ